MLCNDYTTKLLDMEHMEVKNIVVYPDRLIVYVEMERDLLGVRAAELKRTEFMIIVNRR
jgi:hypothetical protein